MSNIDNLPTGGTDDTLQSLSLEQAAALDFDDPDTDNLEAETDQQPEDATDEAESQEADETTAEDDDQTETEDEGTADEADKPEPEDDVTVTVNGERVPLSALKAGYMRQADYSRKTQEVATSRRDLEALSARVTQSVDAIAEFLVTQLPGEPDPQLAMTDPARFVQQKAMHEAAMQRLNSFLGQAGEVKQVADSLTAEQRRELLQSENAKLAEVFPVTATNEGRQKFFDTAASVAKELGYSDQEIMQVMDHRMFALAHYAAIGMRAEKSREKAKVKVQNAPPVAPQKRQQSSNAAQAQRNKEAMKRLARTGSIADAMAIDFD